MAVDRLRQDQETPAAGKLLMRQLPFLTIIAALGLLATAASSAQPESAEAADSPSHIALHRSQPPAKLLMPLEGEQAQVVKGLCVEDEKRIAEQLQSVSLHQRLLRVAVGEVEGVKAALVKFQAGDLLTGQFQLAAMETDAAAALATVFSADTDIRHVDVWSVVPSVANAGGQSHRPVFSLSAARSSYLALADSINNDPQAVRRLGVVRYDPLLLCYASDNPSHNSALVPLPPTAYTKALVGYGADWQHILASNGRLPDNASPEPTVRMMLHGTRSRRRVAITIDDGPCPLITPLILQVLNRHQAVANFFVVGEKAEQYPQLLRDIAQAGHLIGNHTYHHRRLSELGIQEIAAELDACQTVVGWLTGEVMRYLRPPGGDYTAEVLRCASARSQIITLWTHNAGDWANPPVSEIVQRCLTGVRPGSIILMHGGDINSVRALPLIIRGLRARGLEPALLSEMHGPNCPELLTLDVALHLPQNGWQPDKAK